MKLAVVAKIMVVGIVTEEIFMFLRLQVLRKGSYDLMLFIICGSWAD